MLRNLSTTLLCTLAVAAFARVAAAQDPALSADEIVNRALETDTAGFQTGEVVMSLIIQDASGETRERRMQVRGMTENGYSASALRRTRTSTRPCQRACRPMRWLTT
jgi:hypothetical protein